MFYKRCLFLFAAVFDALPSWGVIGPMLMTKFKNVMKMIEFPTAIAFVSPLGTKSVKQKR